jgi:hypothetical protein
MIIHVPFLRFTRLSLHTPIPPQANDRSQRLSIGFVPSARDPPAVLDAGVTFFDPFRFLYLE